MKHMKLRHGSVKCHLTIRYYKRNNMLSGILWSDRKQVSNTNFTETVYYYNNPISFLHTNYHVKHPQNADPRTIKYRK